MRTDKVKILLSKVSVEAVLLILLFFISLTLRLFLLFEFPHVVLLGEADAMGYFAIAKSIINTWGLGDTSVHFPPFYPFLIAIVSLITGNIEIAGRVASCLMGALLIFPVYLIGRELYDERVGFLSAVAVIFLGVFVDFSLQPLSQMTYLTLLLIGIYIGIVLITNRSFPLHFLFGGIFGAVYLTRPEGLVPFIFVAITVSIALLRNSNMAIRNKVKSISLMLIGFSIMALPYITYLHNQTGMWTISGKAAIAAIGVDNSAKLLPSGKTLGESVKGKFGLSDAFPGPQEFLKTYWSNVTKFAKVLPKHFPAVYLFFALIGLLISLTFMFKADSDQRELKVFQTAILLGGVVAVLPVFAFSTLSIAVSYILPVFPILIIWLSVGLVGVEDGLIQLIGSTGFKKLERVKKMVLVSSAVVVLFSYSSFLPVWNELSSEDFRLFAASQEFFLKDTGKWLKYNSSKDSAIMSRWSNMGFYADRKWIYIPDGEISEVVKYAKEHNVSHIVIDSNAVPRRRPRLAPLLNPANYDGLRPVYAREEYWIRVVIYEVL